MKYSHIPVLKKRMHVDKRKVSRLNEMFEVLSAFFEGKDCSIVGLGSSLMSKPPMNNQQVVDSESIFNPVLIFDECHFTGYEHAFAKLNQDYIWQHLPFSYEGDEITSEVFDIETIVKINTLSAIDEFKAISYGNAYKVPVVFQHIHHLNSVIDTLVNYYINTNNSKSTFVLPFHPLEHFLDPNIKFDEAMVVYQEWFAAYQAFSAILQASKASFKVILGMPEWAYSPPSEDELRKYVISEGLSDVYRSPQRRITDRTREESDAVHIDTVNAFELGDIVTIITWQKDSHRQGQEFYYHVMGQQNSIDKLEEEYKCKHLKVTRTEIDLDESMDKLAMLNVSKSLN